jgi:hypothetical protein
MTSPTRHTPSSTHLYGLYDPESSVFTFYKSAAERDEAAEETIRNYLSDGEWCDDVTGICSFMVTHRATQIDVVRPVGEIDEDGCDEAGEDWSNTNCDYKCNYALKPFPTPESPNDVINPPVLATHSTPQPPADGELTVNLRMDLSSECLKRLCDGLAAAVKPNGGYRALTTDDDISGEFIGEQQVGVEWWLPEHGCDSLENTLDSIKGRLRAAVRDWLPIAVISTPQPEPEGLSDEEIESEFRAWWNERYGSAYFGAVPLVSVIEWTQHVTARRPTPQPPADGEVGYALLELRSLVMGLGYAGMHVDAQRLERAADLLERQLPANTLPTPEAPNDVINPPVRYVLHPGYVTSASDGQEHFIDGPRLARLHGLNILNRNVVFGDKPGLRDLPGDIHLRPRFDGDYSVFTPEAPDDVINPPVLATHSTPQPPADGEVAASELVDLAHELRKASEYLRAGCGWNKAVEAIERAIELIEGGVLQRLAPVAVSERPWECEGWCDDEGRCWMGDPGGGGFIPSWRLCRAEDAPSMKVSLPLNALPTPTPEAPNV